MSRAREVLSAAVALAAWAGCRGPEPPPPTPHSNPAEAESITETTSHRPTTRRSLEVPLAARSGSKLSGKASFTEVPEGVRVVIDVAGVASGRHGAHVHEKGDCSAPDAKSAGEHFAPDAHPHALPPNEPRHLGDLGNIEVGTDGTGRLDLVAPGANLRDADRHSFVGRSIIVHAKSDDGSQPSGASGERIGCGEIRP